MQIKLHKLTARLRFCIAERSHTMTNKDKNNNKHVSHIEFKSAGHKAINKLTGEVTWLAPLVLVDPKDNLYSDPLTSEAMNEYSEVYGMDIKWTLNGSHNVKALMVPCKKNDKDTEEEQHALYCSLCNEDWYAQYQATKDGRCEFLQKNGEFKACPTHIKNPNYDPNGPKNPKVNPKKIANRCEHCKFKEFRQSHNVITFSDLQTEKEVDFAESQSALPSVNATSYAVVAEKFFHYIVSQSSNLEATTDKLLDIPEKNNKSEMAREIDIPRNTFCSQIKKIQEMATDFWLEEFGHLPNIA